ncbi:hypothetical protein L6164_015058 [Bauhinia variegata]|uniref:Uncharacterized protein n=1 Tax=Bauhinia variegata TaxID=167791 RepID=A0ACB9NKG2_BAUVA|nr:hypothetical protein L6164_015058 [Bauhinia variegata]
MDPIIFLLLTSSFRFLFVFAAQSPATSSRISVFGVVYCDVCSTNTFSKQSYFLPGVEVHIECKFKAISPKSNEQMNLSVNRTTGEDGVYKLDVRSVDGVNCSDGPAIVSFCQASLIGSPSSPTCNVPLIKTASNKISVKSKQGNLCTLSLDALTYRPYKINTTLCGI